MPVDDTAGKKINGKAESRKRNLIINSDVDQLRTETMNGREYLVAPVIPIVEGVHNDEYMPYEEIVMFPEAWDGRPLPIDHPMTQDGQPATANDPAVFENSVVGYLFNIVARPDIRGISGELWIDIEKAPTVIGGQQVIDKLQNGEGLEVSTGYFTFIDQVPGVWNNSKSGEKEKYTSSQYGVRPDHLALLPFDIGACSIEDGCGAPRINKDDDHAVDSKGKQENSVPNDKDNVKINILESARRPSFKGTESTSWASVNKSFSAYAKTCGGKESVKDASAASKKCIASKSLLGDPAADNARDLIFFPVVNPSTGKLNEGALRAVISGRGAQAGISAKSKASAQEMARKLLKSEFGADLDDDVKKAQVQNAVYLAEKFEQSLTINAEGLVVNGKQMGNHLQAAMACHDNEDGTNDMMERCANAAGISMQTMQGIVSGEHDNVPKHWLNTFSAVLDLDPYDLYSAHSNDSYDARHGGSDNSYARAYKSDKDDVTQSHNDKSKSDCGCKDQKQLVKDAVQQTLKEERSMADKKVTVDGLITNKTTQFNEEHRAWLMTLSEDQLAVLAPKKDPAADDDEDDADAKAKKAKKANEDAAAALAAADAAAKKDAQNAQQPVKVAMSREEIIQILGLTPEAIVAANSAATEKKTAREQMIAEIVTNSKGTYTKEDLAEMSDRLLTKTYEAIQPEVFHGVAGRAVTANAQEEIPRTPSVFLAPQGKEIGRAN